eukprot:COSAG02_NODE_9982_length_2058_cov_1.807044_1_plen_96_part_10
MSASDFDLLARGLNFCVTPTWTLDPDHWNGWQDDFRRFTRSIHRADYFQQRAERKLGALIKPKIVHTEETTPPVAADAEVATSGGGVHREEPEQRQ